MRAAAAAGGSAGHDVDDAGRGRDRYCRFVLYKENKDLFSTIALIARLVRAPRSVFAFTGTKDRRAITTQLVTARGVSADRLRALNARLVGVRLDQFTYVPTELRLGAHSGNRFCIAIRDVQGASDAQIAGAIAALAERGFINYFGAQRFGTSSVPTHHVGRAILRGDWLEAADLVLRPRTSERADDAQAARRMYAQTGVARRDAVRELLKRFPARMEVERLLLLGMLRACPADGSGCTTQQQAAAAFRALPIHLRLLYLHAYQAYVWNHAASERICRYGLRVVEGDLVCAPLASVDDHGVAGGVDDDGNGPSRGRVPVEIVSAAAIDRYSIFDVVLPLFGTESVYPTHDVGRSYYERLLADDGIVLERLEQLGAECVKHACVARSRTLLLTAALAALAWLVRDRLQLVGDERHLVIRPRNVEHQMARYAHPDDTLIETDLARVRREASPVPLQPTCAAADGPYRCAARWWPALRDAAPAQRHVRSHAAPWCWPSRCRAAAMRPWRCASCSWTPRQRITRPPCRPRLCGRRRARRPLERPSRRALCVGIDAVDNDP